MAASIYELDKITNYSGGTEATEFNYRMVDALKSAGFSVERKEGVENPTYVFEVDPSIGMFSKKYDDTVNPSSDFIAVMVCDEADEACPYIGGSSTRFSLRYKDPKYSDGTAAENKVYADKVDEVGREMLFMAKLLKESLDSKSHGTS